MTDRQLPARANVYVDGYNLYHGCFDNLADRAVWRSYRWLDLDRLCQNFCAGRPINRIRYFTALTDDLPPSSPLGQVRQLIDWRALHTIPHLTIHQGLFATNAKSRALADPGARRPRAQIPLSRAFVLEREEKGSDVNLATYLLLDAFHREYDLAIVVSNDSDLAEPIRVVRQELGVQVCIVNPRKKVARGLQGIADDYRNIRFEMVKEAQFPDTLEDETGTFHKPDHWR